MDEWDCLGQAAKVDGFSLHAGVVANDKQWDKLERLCRYVTRPPLSDKRPELTAQGQALPKPPVNLIRYHGVLAPNAKYCTEVDASGGVGAQGATSNLNPLPQTAVIV